MIAFETFEQVGVNRFRMGVAVFDIDVNEGRRLYNGPTNFIGPHDGYCCTVDTEFNIGAVVKRYPIEGGEPNELISFKGNRDCAITLVRPCSYYRMDDATHTILTGMSFGSKPFHLVYGTS